MMISVRHGRLSGKKLPVLGLLILVVLLGLAFAAGVPQKVIETAKVLRTFDSKASLFDARICQCDPDQDVEILRADGLKIAGSLYGIDGEAKQPGILLLHGNTPLGMKLPLYRILATDLAEKNFRVLAIDYTGYGESDDPFSLGTLEALDRDQDVYAALEYLKSLDNLDQDQIYLVGHSGGASPAFSVGQDHPDVSGIVAIGPPRRTSERMLEPRDQDYFWERAKRTRLEVYKSDFPQWYTQEKFVTEKLNTEEMEQHKGYFSQAAHKPLLLIDGEYEDSADLEYLKAYYNSISEPKTYTTVGKSDHYANSSDLNGLVLYDSRAVSGHVDTIENWVTSLRANSSTQQWSDQQRHIMAEAIR